MNKTLHKKLLLQNKEWAAKKLKIEPDFFRKMQSEQKPSVLWIGCSDSRVPATQIIGAEPGEVFVHRNIANLVVHSDMNLLSVVDYAVNILQIKHIIVCGHYGCGGIHIAQENKSYGIIDNWILHIKDIYSAHREELNKIEDKEKKLNRLVEINAIEQVHALAKSTIVQAAWEREQELYLHAWVYSVNSGLVKDLNINVHNNEELDNVYQLSF